MRRDEVQILAHHSGSLDDSPSQPSLKPYISSGYISLFLRKLSLPLLFLLPSLIYFSLLKEASHFITLLHQALKPPEGLLPVIWIMAKIASSQWGMRVESMFRDWNPTSFKGQLKLHIAILTEALAA